jgi:3-deoxy-manno-octulosonate cytidylyltransferase (CMP-KDO synthetase)
LPTSWIERLERLEQLRLLDNGIDVYVAAAPRDTIGVDTEDDLVKAEEELKGRLSPESS